VKTKSDITITVQRHTPLGRYPRDFFVATVFNGGEVVATTKSNVQRRAIRDAKRYSRLYKKHGISVFDIA